jgi:DNA-3-methyladenine glycosylase
LPRLAPDFYARPTVEVARSLLGCKLVVSIPSHFNPVENPSHALPESRTLCSGIIVETEAYLDKDDPACHASRGMTRRNEVMFGPPGKLYVYTIHTRFCANIVTEPIGRGAAVLIRAIQPVDGIDGMQRNRPLPPALSSAKSLVELGNGPGKLCQSLALDTERNGACLTTGNDIWVETTSNRDFYITCTPRIGISSGVDLPLRFFVDGNRYVSGKASDHRLTRRSELATE